MKSNKLWSMIGIAGLAATLLFAGGFAMAVRTVVYPAESNVLPAAQGKPPSSLSVTDRINIVALGDSLTRGTGDQTGKGYVGYTKEKLEKLYNKPVYVLANYSVNGYATQQLVNDLRSKTGIADSIKQAHVVMLTIGGNDLFALGTEPNIQKVRAAFDPTLKRLDEILGLIRSYNKDARVVYVALYNPFYDLPNLRTEMSLGAADFNREAYRLVLKRENMTMVPTYDLFEQRVGDYLSSDHFHPNSAGYERVADRIVQVLE